MQPLMRPPTQSKWGGVAKVVGTGLLGIAEVTRKEQMEAQRQANMERIRQENRKWQKEDQDTQQKQKDADRLSDQAFQLERDANNRTQRLEEQKNQNVWNVVRDEAKSVQTAMRDETLQGYKLTQIAETAKGYRQRGATPAKIIMMDRLMLPKEKGGLGLSADAAWKEVNERADLSDRALATEIYADMIKDRKDNFRSIHKNKTDAQLQEAAIQQVNQFNNRWDEMNGITNNNANPSVVPQPGSTTPRPSRSGYNTVQEWMAAVKQWEQTQGQ